MKTFIVIGTIAAFAFAALPANAENMGSAKSGMGGAEAALIAKGRGPHCPRQVLQWHGRLQRQIRCPEGSRSGARATLSGKHSRANDRGKLPEFVPGW
jgi:hypothetical protein